MTQSNHPLLIGKDSHQCVECRQKQDKMAVYAGSHAI